MGEVSDKCGPHSLQCRKAVSQLYFQNISYTLQSVKGSNFKELISESRNGLKTKKVLRWNNNSVYCSCRARIAQYSDYCLVQNV
jgi:hypothetical protein